MKKFILAMILMMVGNQAMAAAAAVDVSEAVTQIGTHGTAAITSVGTVIIVLAAVAVVFKWVKGAIFG